MPDSIANRSGTVLSRLEMCRDIMKLRDSAEKAPAATKDRAETLARRRIESLRTVLLNRPGRTMADDLLSPIVGYRGLLDLLEAAQNQPKDKRLRVAIYAKEIRKMLTTIVRAELESGIVDGISNIWMDAESPTKIDQLVNDIIADSADMSIVDSSVDSHITRGKFGEDLREEVAKAAGTAGALTIQSLRIEDINPELAAELAAAKAELDRLYDHYSQINRDRIEAKRGIEDDEERSRVDQQFREEQNNAYADFLKYSEESMRETQSKVHEALKQGLELAQKPIADVGRKALEDVLSASPISQEQADIWAARVEITKAATNRLKKMGYAPEAFRADMAEFYRFTGGRVSKVKIDSKGDRRANATQITSHGTTGSVFLDSDFTKRTLWHELAHHLEADPVARQASGRLIRRRSVDGKSYSLRSLTGNKGYQSSEVAFKDGFFSPYVGKIYRDGITEVFSMGVESFSDPLLLGRRMADDPQTLEFVAGYLKEDITPEARAFMALRDIMDEINSEAKEKEADTADELIAKLASEIEITNDTDKGWVDDWYSLRAYKGKQIGTFEGWYILEDRVRNYSAGGRKTPGYVLLNPKTEPDPYFPNEKVRKVVNLMNLASRDKATLRAAISVFKKTGRFPGISDMNNVAFLLSHINQ